MRHIFLFLLISLSLHSCGQTLICKDSWFLSASAESNYIVYFKAEESEPDEYPEGHIFIYDVKKNENFPLNKETYILDFLNVSWSPDNDAYFMSSGTSLDYYSFATNKKLNLFSSGKDGMINGFSVSNNGKLLVLNEKIVTDSNSIQVSYLINIEKKSIDKIFEIKDSSVGEILKNNFLFDSTGENVFIETISGELIKFNIKSSSHQTIDNNINKIFCISGDYLYYQKNKSLIQYNYKNKEQFEIIKGESNINIQYVNIAQGNNIVINLNDNVFFYNENRGLEKSSLPKGEYVYIKNGLAIETLDNSLYFRSF